MRAQMRNAELLPGSPVSTCVRADAAEELEHWLREQRQDPMSCIARHLPQDLEVLRAIAFFEFTPV